MDGKHGLAAGYAYWWSMGFKSQFCAFLAPGEDTMNRRKEEDRRQVGAAGAHVRV